MITKAAASKRNNIPTCPTCKDALKLTAAEYPIYEIIEGGIKLDQCQVVTAKWCYDVSPSSLGGLLVGRVAGFDIVSDEAEIIKSVSTGTEAVVSIQHYNDKIYTVSLSGNNHQQVMEFDTSDYWETQRWSVSYVQHLSKLAVSNDKVYVTDPQKQVLQVYNLTGEIIKYIKHQTFENPVYFYLITPGNVLISDCKPSNRLYKLNCSEDKVVWSCDIDQPVGICCDRRGDIWVWSDKTRTLFVLCGETGKIKQEIRHEKFAEVAHFMGIHISEQNVLWAAAYDKGLIKFNITYPEADGTVNGT